MGETKHEEEMNLLTPSSNLPFGRSQRLFLRIKRILFSLITIPPEVLILLLICPHFV